MSGLSALVRRYVAPSAAALATLIVAPALAEAGGPSDEQKFLAATHQLPAYVLPQGDHSTDADILAGGYGRARPSTNIRTTQRRWRGSTFRAATLSDGQFTYDGQLFMTRSSFSM